MTRVPWEESESHDELEKLRAVLSGCFLGRDLTSGEIGAAAETIQKLYVDRYYVPKAEYDRKVRDMEKELLEAKGERELLEGEFPPNFVGGLPPIERRELLSDEE